MKRAVIGVDIGGTKIAVGLLYDEQWWYLE
jgi:hypothetical protein